MPTTSLSETQPDQNLWLLRRVNTGAEYWTVCPVPIQCACYATTNRSPTRTPFATYCRWLKPRRAALAMEGAMMPYYFFGWAALAQESVSFTLVWCYSYKCPTVAQKGC
jgi:hypothetical protein